MKDIKKISGLLKKSLKLSSKVEISKDEELLIDDEDMDFGRINKPLRQPQKLKYHPLKNNQTEVEKHIPQNFHTQTKTINNKSIGKNFVVERKNSQNNKDEKKHKYMLSERDFYSILHGEEEEQQHQESIKKYAKQNGIDQKTFVRQKSRSRSFLKENNKSPQKSVSKVRNKIARLKNILENKKKIANVEKSRSPVFEKAKSRNKDQIQSKNDLKNVKLLQKSDPRQLSRNKINNTPDQNKNQKKGQKNDFNAQQVISHKRTNSLIMDDDSQYAAQIEKSEAKSNRSFYKSSSVKVAGMSKSIERMRSKRKIKQFDTDLTFRPMLSKKSLQIAERLGKSSERLTKNLYNENDSQEENDKNRKKATPKINKVSEILANNARGNLNAKDRFERLFEYSKIYKKTNEDLRIKKIEEDLQKELIIGRPKTPKKQKSNQFDENEHFFTSEVDVSQRNNLWQSKIKEKIEKLKGQTNEVQLKECTFKPQVEDSRISYKRQNSKSLTKTSDFMKDGLMDYFRRKEIAKQKTSYCELKNIRTSNFDEGSGYMQRKDSDVYEKNDSRLKNSGHVSSPVQQITSTQQSQKWSNSQALNDTASDADKKKIQAMLNNLKNII